MCWVSITGVGRQLNVLCVNFMQVVGVDYRCWASIKSVMCQLHAGVMRQLEFLIDLT